MIGKKKKKKKKKSESPQFNNVANTNVDLARAPEWAVSTSKPNKQANSGVEGHALFSGFNKAGESDAKSKSFEGSDGLFKVKDKRVVSFGERFGSGAGTKSDNVLNSNSKTELSNNEVDDQKKKKKKKKRKRTRTKKGADEQETESEMFGGFVFSASSVAK